MKLVKLFFLLLLPLFLLAGCPKTTGKSVKNKGNNSESVKVIGRAQVFNSDEQSAYDKAKEFGLREAIEKVVGASLLSETQVIDGSLIEDNIFSRSVGYVEDFRVTKEWNEKEGSIIVKKLEMLVWVKKDLLNDDILALRSLQLRLDLPLLVVRSLSDTKSAGAGGGSGAGGAGGGNLFPVSLNMQQKIAASVQQQFLEKQFYFLDGEEVKSGAADVELIFSSTYSVNDLSGLDDLPKGFSSVKVFVNVKAVRAGSGFLIFSKNLSSPGAGLSVEGALENAFNRILPSLAEEMTKKLIDAWREEAEVGKDFFVIFSDVDVGKADQIRQALSPRKLEGVELVIDKGFEKKTLRFLVRYRYALPQLISLLQNLKQDLFALDLVKYGKRTVHFRLK